MCTLPRVMNINLSLQPPELEPEGGLPWGAAAFSTIRWDLSSCSLWGGSCGNKYYPRSLPVQLGPPGAEPQRKPAGRGCWGGNTAGKVSLEA